MPRKCTICESDLRPAIEVKLMSGDGTKEIAAWATDNGLAVSHMAVQRHKSHIENYTAPDTEQPGINAADFLDGLQLDPPKFRTGDELLNFSRETARAILANQLLIVRTKQEAYMQGKGRYPSAEIQALKTFVSCVGDIVSGSKTIYKDNAILDA